MKIGVITFHWANNFGAVLQALALTKILNEMGHEAKIIDYRPPYNTNAYKPFKIIKKYSSFKHFLLDVFLVPFKYKSEKKFILFNSKNMETWDKSYYSSDEIINNPPQVDVVVIGSDQVWNPQYFDGVDKVYFLGFGSNIMKRIAFAPSFGTSNIDKKFWSEMSTYIKNMDAVSVRELDGKEIVKKMTGIEATHVLDPVFLLDKAEWNKFGSKRVTMNEPYILLYSKERSKLLSDVAYKIAKERRLKIVNISPIMIGLKKYDKNLFSIGPEQFLELINNATVICTNSFHGTAFSILYGKPFIVVPHRTRNTRIESILKTLELLGQLITDMKQFDKKTTEELIHYDLERTKYLLEKAREKSFIFLNRALNNNNRENGDDV